VAGQGVRLPQKLGEVEHGVVAAGVVEGGVDGELLPGAVPDDDVRVAADRYAVVPVEVDDHLVPNSVNSTGSSFSFGFGVSFRGLLSESLSLPDISEIKTVVSRTLKPRLCLGLVAYL
jgi:hypothetical protein